ncbi:hypothetical protein [Tunturiibacter gelidoferens]|uniref:Uncharacterized protein n=1 Tax=Tunturiibacter gelidiferens TaxID=3069689 RepID=A0ACC5P1Y8_9BACT|nr:hypothetical protein [Edaphobacter lichenicola]MBB5340857.1 hypothetical protein [Edaphobacter lichenicola]
MCVLQDYPPLGAGPTVFAIDVNGTLNVYYTSGAGWASQKILPHIALTPGVPLAASQQFIPGVNQTNLMTFDPSGVLNIFYWRERGPGIGRR